MIGQGALPVTLVAERLARAGCVAPLEEAQELAAAAGGDAARLASLMARRLTGEPLAWITGGTTFFGLRIRVDPGVYVPRWQSEQLVARAIPALPDAGLAIDLCTGSGAVAVALGHARPGARVIGTDLDAAAFRCAQANGVEALQGHLDEPLPAEVRGRCDVVTAVPPYVPTGRLAYLPRDVRDWEPRPALDGGTDGLDIVRHLVRAGDRLLRPGGRLFVEVGGDQDVILTKLLTRAGFRSIEAFADEDGDLRGVEAVRGRRVLQTLDVSKKGA